MEKAPRNADKKLKWVFDSQVKNMLYTKVGICVAAVLLGLVLLILCVYVIIPSIISNASDRIDQSYAKRMYESTLSSPPPDESARPVFVPGDYTVGAQSEPRDCFATALAENPDVIGRIMLYEIGIAYLVVQSDDNERYQNTGYDGSGSRAGAVFLDYRCDAGRPLRGHYILYGRNMENGTMFNSLMMLKDSQTFYANRMIRFDTLYEDHVWEIFSAYITSADYAKTNFAGREDWLGFLKEIQQKSMFETNTALSADDVVLTLSTPMYETQNARFVVHARLVK